MARSSAVIDRNLINFDIDTSGKTTPTVSKQEESAPFSSWNPDTNTWKDTKPDTTFNGNISTSEFLNNYSKVLTETTTQIINQYNPETRNNFLTYGTFTQGIIGNGTTSNSPEAGTSGSGGPQVTTASRGGTGESSPSKPLTVNYRYPTKFSKEFDYLLITKYEYVSSENSVRRPVEGQFNIKSVQERMIAGKSPKGSISLPMYPGISESNQVSWGGDELNAIQAFFGNTASNAINNLGDADPFGAFSGIVNDVMSGLGYAADNENVSNFLTQYFAGQAVGANLVTRNTGLAINPNLELLFNKPSLRSFTYNYRFTPRDNYESAEIKNIILFLKRGMAPKKQDALFLKTPDVFRLQYIFGKTNKEHPFLNKIKLCALTSLNIDYTPDGSYMTYQDGSPTSYSVSMTFSELEPIYDTDFGDNDSSSMGY